MSAQSTAAHAAGNDDHHHGAVHPHGTLRDYLIGFALSVVLTAVPFWLVMGGVLESKLVTALLVMALAMVQIVVHVIYFLHMTSRAEEGWSLMSLIFTAVIIVITLAGSLWVMHHLNTNTMPSHDVRQMP